MICERVIQDIEKKNREKQQEVNQLKAKLECLESQSKGLPIGAGSEKERLLKLKKDANLDVNFVEVATLS